MNRIKNDISVRIKGAHEAVIRTNDHIFEIYVSNSTSDVLLLSNCRFPMRALDDMERFQIFLIDRYFVSEEKVKFSLSKKEGFNIFRMVDAVIYIIESYEL